MPPRAATPPGTAPQIRRIRHISLDERLNQGQTARDRTPPSSHAGWSPAADRPDPVGLLEQQDRTREPDLVPVRHGRMMVSPFTFYRGAAKIMAADLKDTPVAGLDAQLCGDAHLSNFGMFASPNRAAVMNSLPPSDRGAGGGMNQTFQNSAQVISIGVFFTLMIAGLAASLPAAMYGGLTAHGVPAAAAHRVAALPPVSILFAAFLGYNPIQQLLGGQLSALPPDQASFLTGRSFFPNLISGPFHTAIVYAFAFAIVACLIAAVASLLRGGKYHHEEVTMSDLVAVEEAA